MRIAIDGTIWGGPETGVSVATRRLVRRLAEANADHDLTEFVSCDVDRGVTETKAERCHRVVSCRRRQGLSRVLWQQFVLPRLTRRHHVDVLYCPCYTVPILLKVPAVVTVHDLIAWTCPHVCRAVNVAHFRLLVGRSIRFGSNPNVKSDHSCLASITGGEQARRILRIAPLV